MKDYTLSVKDRMDFILKYEKEEDMIIIYYADGSIYRDVCTKELEIDILKKMKQQVENAGDYNKKNKITRAVVTAGSMGLTFLCVVTGFYLGLIPVGGLFIKFNYSLKKKMKDYNKNLTFINNQELFQTYISEDMGKYLSASHRSEKVLNELIEKNETTKEEVVELREPTINTIDGINNKVFKELYDVVLRNQEFSKYYENTDVKKRVLKKEPVKKSEEDVNS